MLEYHRPQLKAAARRAMRGQRPHPMFVTFVFSILAGIGGTFVGALTENYVAQQLSAIGYPLHYWTRDNRAEIDFVVERQGCVSAIEVKAGENTRSRSLSSLKKSHPGVRLIRLSTKPFGMNEGLRSIPLYAAFCL